MKWNRISFGIVVLALTTNLASLLIFNCTACGGELAMLQFILNFPSSILTGWLLNQINWTTNAAWHAWWPFFAAGMLQWIGLALIWARFSPQK